MDHFFTAVEEREHPEFKGKPVIVGADPKEGKGRGVVSTCNYEARKFGVRSGMPISKAWKRCPQAVYLPVNFKLYMKVSSRIMAILRKYADRFEPFGIDEAFLDISERAKNFKEARRIAEKIKREIYEKEGLTCSIGVGPNKLVAKIASDFKKPDGLTVVREEEVKRFLSPLPVERLWGIGKKTGRKLRMMSIKTIGELAACNPSRLKEKFGVLGIQFHRMAHGIGGSEVGGVWEAKSISRETTFEQDTSDHEFILKSLDELCEKLHKEIADSNLYFKTVTVKIRYKNFETHTHGKTLPFNTNRLKDLQKIARELIQDYFKAGRKVRLIGVRVSKLVSGERQRKLLEHT